VANDYFQPPDGSDDVSVQTGDGKLPFGLGDQSIQITDQPSVANNQVVSNKKEEKTLKYLGTNLSTINQVKQLDLQDFNPKALAEFLATVDQIFDQSDGLRPDQTAIFKTVELGQKSFSIFNPQNPQQAHENRGSYLFPSDFARFLIQVAEKTELLVLAVHAKNPPIGLAGYKAKNWQYYVRQWGRTIDVKQDSGQDAVDEISLLSSISLGQQNVLINLLKEAYDFVQGRQDETKVDESEEESEETPKQASDQGKVIGGGKTKGASETKEEAESEGEKEEVAEENVPKSVTPEARRQFAKAVSYETAWVYNRLLLELFTSQGINADKVDPLLLSELYGAVSGELWKKNPSELARLFASPSARQRTLQEVYGVISQNPRIVSLIYQTRNKHKADQDLELDAGQAGLDNDAPPNFQKELEKELLETDEDSPDEIFEAQLDDLLKQIGGVSDNLSPDVNPIIINAKDQVEFLLRTFGVSPKDLVPEHILNPNLEIQSAKITRALAVVDSLSVRQLWLTIFPELDAKKMTSAELEKRRLQIDQRFAPFLDKLQSLIKSYLKVRATELSLEHQAWHANQVIAPKEVADQINQEAKDQPKLPPHTLSQYHALSLSSNPSLQDEEDEINSKRGSKFAAQGQDEEEETKDRQKRSGHGFDIKNKQLAGFIAQYQRAWEFLPSYVKLVAYQKSGLLETLPLPRGFTKEKLLGLSAPQLDKLIHQQGDFLTFDEAVFFRAPLDGVMAEARKFIGQTQRSSTQAKEAIDEAIKARGDFVLAVAKQKKLEAERQQRIEAYIKQLSAQRRQEISAFVKAEIAGQIYAQQAALEAHQIALITSLAEIGQQISQAETAEFEAQYLELVDQLEAAEQAQIGDFSLNDVMAADASLDESSGQQKLSLRERLSGRLSSSANSRAQQMMAQAAQKKMGEEVALKMLAKAGWQGRAAAFAIKHRKKIAAIWGGAVGGLTSLIIGQIMKYGKIALNGAIVGGVGGAVGGAILGAQIGGAIGAFFGGIGAPIGAVIGGIVGGITGAVAGGAAGSFVAVKIAQSGGISVGPPIRSAIQTVGQVINPSSGPAYLPQTGSSLSSLGTSSELSGSLGGQPLAQAAPTYAQVAHAAPALSPASSAIVGVKAAGAWAAGSGIALSSTIITIGLIVMTSAYTMYIIFSAFLAPLPVGNSNSKNISQSKYLTLSKTASPTQLPNNSGDTTITYTITLKPRPGYIIEVTQLSDVFSYHSGAEVNSPPSQNPSQSPLSIEDIIADPAITDPQDYDPMISTLKTTQYQIVLSGGANTQVQNQLTVTFNVYSVKNPTDILTTETQTTMATVDIGDPMVNCWPVSGTITQLPWGSYSHTNSDAYDIAAPLGSDVRAPFAGTLLPANVSKTIYGPYPVYLRFNYGGQQRHLLFGHLMSTTVDMNNATGISVNSGDIIGKVGNGGKSTGPHLHYALIGSTKGGTGLKLRDLIPAEDVNITVGSSVYTCLGI